MVAPLHDKRHAQIIRRAILNAKPDKRRPFALGLLGGYGVMNVARGKPPAAANPLHAMRFEEGNKPKELKGDQYRALVQGLLFLDGTTLVLQCKKTVPGAARKYITKYFKHFHLKVPFQKIISTEVDNDDGDGDDGTPDVEVDETALFAADEVLDDADEGGAAPADAPPANGNAETVVAEPPPAEDKVTTDPTKSPSRVEASADVKAKAATLAKYVLKMATDVASAGFDLDTLGRNLETMLQNVPMERLLLLLSASRNARALLDVEKIADQPPIERNDQGVADIASGLSSMLANVAREKGVLGEGEVIDQASVASMVKATWKEGVSAAEVVQTVMDVLWTSQSKGDKWVRGILGLKGPMPSKPAPGVAAAQPDDSGAAPATLALEQALAGLQNDQAVAFAAINRLANAIADEFADDAEQAGALGKALERLHGLAARMNDAGLNMSLRAVLEAPTAGQIVGAQALVEAMIQFANEDEVVSSIDGNEITPDMQVVAPLVNRLQAVRERLLELASPIAA